MGLVNIKDFRGGLNLNESTTLDDNQFESLINMFYSADSRIQSRKGIKEFGNSIGTAPITSYFFFQNDSTLERIALATAGTEMYKYNEGTGNWSSIKTGLTEFEADGITRTRWDFAVYKNIIYMCNGLDNYASYDGTTYSEYATQPKIRYIEYMQDRIYGAGDDDNPSTLYYTDTAPLNAQAINTNLVVIGGDELGRINGIKEIGQIIVAFKNKKSYSVDVVNESALPLDADNGGYANRSITNVGNALGYFNDRGIETLKQRSGVSGTSALESKPLSDNIRKAISTVQPKNYNYTVSNYILPLTNYYNTIDTSGENIPDTTYVYSALTKGWSEYTFPALNDYGFYIDEDGAYHYLIASANTGQMYEIEVGLDDLGLAIPCELATKKWDFGDITRFKTFPYIDVVGLKSTGDSIEVDILIDDEVVGGTTIDDSFITSETSALTIGTGPVGSLPIGGGASGGDEVDLFSYRVRIPLYQTGATIQLKMTSESANLVWTLDKVTVNKDNEDKDLFIYNNIG